MKKCRGRNHVAQECHRFLIPDSCFLIPEWMRAMIPKMRALLEVRSLLRSSVLRSAWPVPGSGPAGPKGPDRDPAAGEVRRPGGHARHDRPDAGRPVLRLEATLEQSGKSYPVFTLEPRRRKGRADRKPKSADHVQRADRQARHPELKSGPARIVVRAARPVLYGLRQAESVANRDVEVRLEPPRVAVLSTFHYVNHRRQRVRGLPRHAGGRGVRRARRRQGVSRLPGQRRGHHRRIRRCASPSSRCCTTRTLEHADSGVRARRGRQRGARAARPPGVPEAVREEPHRDRRRVPAARRAGDRRRNAPDEEHRRPTTCSPAS